MQQLFEGNIKCNIVILHIKLTKLMPFDFDYNGPQCLFGGGAY